MSHPVLYAIFELFQALALTGIWIYSWFDSCGLRYFAFLTHWSLTLQTTYAWLDFYTTSKASAMKAGKIERVELIPVYAQINWFMYDLLIPSTFLVFALYFGLVVDYSNPPKQPLSYLTHGLNFVIMITNAYLSKKPYYLLHGLYFMVFCFIFVTWTYAYYLMGGTDCDGNRYLYEVLDWGENFDGVKTLGGIIVFIVAPVTNFLFWFTISSWFPGSRPSVSINVGDLDKGNDKV